MNISRFCITIVVSILSAPFLAWSAGGEMPYGHISYFEGDVLVTRLDGQVDDAKVNLPLVPGDLIATGSDGRVEFQFDNGSIFRLDRNTELKLVTVLAPSLTSRWKITTLNLLRGQSYSINQSYRFEMFQVITPKAAVFLKNSSTIVIAVEDGGETRVFSERGKARVMFGRGINALNEETVRSGRGFRITAGDRFVPDEKRDPDFLAWNKWVNKDFKDLHYGISNVPKQIFRYSPGLVHWAEKWSTTYGEWIYNDLFGYVWKPAADIFADRRPFFDADYVRINGKLFLVPQQAWGWAPAYMGTWHWGGKSGWIWIPGDVFSDHIWSWGSFTQNWMWHGLTSYSYWMMYPFPWAFGNWDYRWRSQYPLGMMGDLPILDDWLFWVYGDWDLYHVYRTRGEKEWREFYLRKKGMLPPDRDSLLKSIPRPVRGLIKKIDHAPIDRVQSDFPARSAPPVQTNEPRWITPAVPSGIAPARVGVTMISGGTGAVARQVRFRDWNPDLKMTIATGVPYEYSSKANDTFLRYEHLRRGDGTRLSGFGIFARDLSSSDRTYLGRVSAAGNVHSLFEEGHWNRQFSGSSSYPSAGGSTGAGARMMDHSQPSPPARKVD